MTSVLKNQAHGACSSTHAPIFLQEASELNLSSDFVVNQASRLPCQQLNKNRKDSQRDCLLEPGNNSEMT